jgi:hypothetical protein
MFLILVLAATVAAHSPIRAAGMVEAPNDRDSTNDRVAACDPSEISRCHVSCDGCIDCLELGFVLFPCEIPSGYHSLSVPFVERMQAQLNIYRYLPGNRMSEIPAGLFRSHGYPELTLEM